MSENNSKFWLGKKFSEEHKQKLRGKRLNWHGNSGSFKKGHKTEMTSEIRKRKEIDIKQNAILGLNGYKVVRFWEHQINESVENCIKQINLEGITNGLQ